MSIFGQIEAKIRQLANPKTAEKNQKFFKTAQGEYGENDLFLGIRIPELRKLLPLSCQLSFKETLVFLKSPYHEKRMLALLTLVQQYVKTQDVETQEKIYQIYTQNFRYVNNWDLVDSSAPYILGPYFLTRDRKMLYQWIESSHLWTRRIAMMTNLWFIKQNDLRDVFPMAKKLLSDTHDLIHKATGWMLRIAGQKNPEQLKKFLDLHTPEMPRTMLRYAIEKLPENQRKYYLKK